MADEKLEARLKDLGDATRGLGSVTGMMARAVGSLTSAAVAGGPSPSVPAASPQPTRAPSAPPGPVGDLVRELLGGGQPPPEPSGVRSERTPSASELVRKTPDQLRRDAINAVKVDYSLRPTPTRPLDADRLKEAIAGGQPAVTPPGVAARPSVPTVNLQQAVTNLVAQAAGGQPPQPPPARPAAPGAPGQPGSPGTPAPPSRPRPSSFLGGVGQSIGKRLGRGVKNWWRGSRLGQTVGGIRQAVSRFRAAKTPAAKGRAAVALGGKLAGGLGTAATALYEFQKAVHGASEANLQAQRRFAESSAAMAAVLAQLDVRQTFREMEMGNRLAPSARRLAEATDKRRESTKEAEILVTGVKNDVLAFFENGFAKALDAFSPLFRAINKYLGHGEEDDGKRVATAQDWTEAAERRANAADAKGNAEVEAARRQSDAYQGIARRAFPWMRFD